MKTIKVLITISILLTVIGGQWHGTGTGSAQSSTPDKPNSATPPLNYQPMFSQTEKITETDDADILLIQTAWPWNSTADVDVLNSLGYSYDIVDMSNISSVDIFSYPVVLIVNDQVQAFYDSYAQQVEAFENYVSNGGTLVFFAASDGWALGTLTAPLPGGVTVNTPDYENYNYIVDTTHPVVTGMLSDGIPLLDADMYGNYTSHGTFSDLVVGTNTLFRDDEMMPTMIEYELGSGRVIASTNTWEFHYIYSYGEWARKALDDVFLYAFTGGVLPSDDVLMDLHIEDAPEGVIVNKVAGDASGATGLTSVDVVAKAISYNWDIHEGITMTLQVEGNVLGVPQHTYFRWLDASTLSEIPFEDLGDGKYQVVVDLPGIWFWHFGQVVWRFAIPADASAQQVDLEATIVAPDYPLVDPTSQGILNLVNNPDSFIITNRKLLYENYSDGDVSELLAMLYTIGQGPPRNNNPISVIYYVDQYSTDARDWDQNPTYPGTEASVNTVANAVDGLIDDWYNDATTYYTIEIVPGVTIDVPVITPDYLTILGDDDIVPFYRYSDPNNIMPEEDWRITNANNPAINATDHNYFFTDNVYADLGGGTDWQTGNLELAVGRIVGDTAEEMNEFLLHGVNSSDQNSGRIVMASVDGWELGQVPHSGPGAADLYNVPTLFTTHGFEVLNDTENPITIDILSPAGWDETDLEDAASDGLDLFFIGGHNSYNEAFINDDSDHLFSPDDTPTDYDDFDDNGPLAMIVGCHGGLSVPDAGGIGGADDNMVRDLVHEGASGYIGATGFSYGSPRNLHNCTWGENLIQRYFNRFLLPSVSASETIGKAMQQAKDEYVFGIGGNDGVDRKTVTEYVVYGVPWQRINYPGDATQAAMLSVPEDEVFGIASPVQAEATNTYSQIIDIQVSDYEHTEEDGFDLLSIPGGFMDYSSGYPVIPFIQGFSLPLPYNATIETIEILDQEYTQIGPYNLPIVQVAPWSEGGITFTDYTSLNEYYPANLASFQTDLNEAQFYLSPIQHNPTTNETRFYDHFSIKITYTAPLALSISDFQTDKNSYSPTDFITVKGRVHNIGDQDTNAVVLMSFVDPYGVTVGSVTQLDVMVPAGGYIDLEDSFSPMPAGAFTALWEVQIDGYTIAWAESPISILEAGITGFTYPNLLVSGEYGLFSLTFTNHSENYLPVDAEIVLYDQATGLEAGRLLRQNLTIDPYQVQDAIWNWDSATVPFGSYTALATVYSGASIYGPAMGTFKVVSDTPPDLTSSSMSVDKAEAKAGDTLTYTMEINNTSAITATNVLVEDTIPWGTSYVADSTEASSGILFDSNGIKWFGEIPPGETIVITFQVQVEQVNGLTIQNQATVTDPAIANPIFLQADTLIPPVYRILLPLLNR